MSVREIELATGDTLEITQSTELENEAGAVVWDSGIVLAHYLAELSLQERRQAGGAEGGAGARAGAGAGGDAGREQDDGDGDQEAAAALERHRQRHGVPRIAGARVLELGAGTGAVGLAAARLGAARVLLTDRPALVDLMARNAAANGLEGVAEARAYEWGAAPPVAPPAAVAGAGGDAAVSSEWDLVLLSDLVYDPDALAPLVETLSALLGGRALRSAGGGGGGGGGAAAVAESNGNGASVAAPHPPVAPPPPPPPKTTALIAVELREDVGVAAFIRALVGRGLFVERVPHEELSEDWRDDDVWVFTARNAAYAPGRRGV